MNTRIAATAAFLAIAAVPAAIAYADPADPTPTTTTSAAPAPDPTQGTIPDLSTSEPIQYPFGGDR